MRYMHPHVPFMAWIHGVIIFSTLFFIYSWIFASKKHVAVTVKHMVHMVEHYEEDEQWHEDFDFRDVEII